MQPMCYRADSLLQTPYSPMIGMPNLTLGSVSSLLRELLMHAQRGLLTMSQCVPGRMAAETLPCEQPLRDGSVTGRIQERRQKVDEEGDIPRCPSYE